MEQGSTPEKEQRVLFILTNVPSLEAAKMVTYCECPVTWYRVDGQLIIEQIHDERLCYVVWLAMRINRKRKLP